MTIPVVSTIPDREALRTLYDEAIKQINPSRSAIDLTTGFYAETGNAVFDAGYLALSDYCKGSAGPRCHSACNFDPLSRGIGVQN
jgi:hypothetical protein